MEMRQCIPALGSMAPDFTAMTTHGPVRMSDYKGRWLVFFSHPGDFTPICTTEFLAFSRNYSRFQALNCDLLGLSIDSNPSHIAWILNIVDFSGITVPFPIVADRSGDVARLYGMLPSPQSYATVRMVFFIDPDQKIRAVLDYPYTNGRCIEEILRLLEAMQATDREELYTPACWQPGDPMIVPPPDNVDEALRRQQCGAACNCETFYLCYEQPDPNTTGRSGK